MTYQEYFLCSHGYFMRISRQNEGLRRIYVLLWNSNVKKTDALDSAIKIRKEWPLMTDVINTEINSDERRKRWQAQKAQNDFARRQILINGR
jgi:hypothetical protein